jgi:hypothetical protein
VIAHGALNGAAAAPVLFAQAGAPYDTALVGITGVTGWILPLALIGLLVGLRCLPVPDAPDLAWAADADGATPVAREASTA